MISFHSYEMIGNWNYYLKFFVMELISIMHYIHIQYTFFLGYWEYFYHVWRANIPQYNASGLKPPYMQESISSANFYHGNFNHIPFVPIVFGINIAFRIRIQTFNRICMQQINLLWLVWRGIRAWNIINDVEYFYVSLLFLYFFFFFNF